MGPVNRFWEEKRLDQMSKPEWESLCDGCGKCCLHKLEDEDTGEVFPTNVACRLLDRRDGNCRDYPNRKRFVPDCVQLSASKLNELEWLPSTCAYRLVFEGKPLFDWHYLISGSRETVHAAGMSTRGWTVSETEAGELELHLTDREL